MAGLFDLCRGGTMQDQPEVTPTEKGRPAQSGGGGLAKNKGMAKNWPTLAGLTFGLVAGAISVRSTGGPRFDGLLIFAAGAAGIAVALLSIRLLLSNSPAPEPTAVHASGKLASPLQDVFDSAGPAVVSISSDGRLTYVNPSAERLLGYHAHEMMKEWTTVEILAPGEGARLVAEMEKLCGVPRSAEPTPAGQMAAYLNCVRSLPPSQVPSFDARLRHKDGTLLPVPLHISALRDAAGESTGLVAVALDQSATVRQELALRESQERFRDLFENSSEMIATLSPAGKFLYANPAWKRCFDLDQAALLALESFEDLFGTGCRAEVAAHFRSALEGEPVDRAPLRHHTPDGRVLEFELSLSQRQKAGNPLAVRCHLRDVTHQKQREHRLALQLVVSQIVGENASPDVASMRILEALCISQGWDLAIKWKVDT